MSSQQDDIDENPPPITYTRKRTTTKTRTAASSARRRNNLPLCHASSSGGADDDVKDQHSWFARKSAMWTDEQIRNHLVSGGATSSNSADGVSFVGDVIMGAKEETRKKRKRHRGPRFAWEEEEEEGGLSSVIQGSTQRITAAPTLMDIMDEKDEADLMPPLKVGKEFDARNIVNDTGVSKKRSQNAALAQLAMISESTITNAAPTDGNSSIGWNLLRVWGYRYRLGVALVPLQGFDKTDNWIDSLDESATHEAKWLASKRLRAIYLPSIQHKNSNEDGAVNECKSVDIGVSTKNKSRVLIIPPPKTNRHGIGYDPFRNAPEFRAFHEHRLRMAQRHGKEDGGESMEGRKRNRYFTNDLGKNVHPLWEHAKSKTAKDDFDDDTDDNHEDNACKDRPSHYAADRNYEHLIGSNASSGFALEDEDDANVYDGNAHSFPSRLTKNHDGENSRYASEIQSPVASDEEDNGADSNLFGDLSTTQSKASVKSSKLSITESAGENLADAWSAWGLGLRNSALVNNGTTQLPLTQDGKPPLAGFVLSSKVVEISSNHMDRDSVPKRWRGPTLPEGYVLKRHVFAKENGSRLMSDDELDRTDCGLGLDLQCLPQQRYVRARSMPPKVLPSSEADGSVTARKLVAKDGTALNFHAVRESMKNRFVSGSTSISEENSQAISQVADIDYEEEQEMIDVTISTWVPSRLLCKRWGVPMPTNYGESTNESDVKRTGEEEFFRSTIYDPAVANLHGQTKPSDWSNNMTTEPPTVTKAVDLNSLIEVDDSAAPSRPSESIFQSIFDVQSDMDISDDDEAVEDETTTSTGITSKNDSKTRGNDNGDSTIADNARLPAPDAQGPYNKSPSIEMHRDYSIPSSNESSSSVSDLKRKHKHVHRHERHRRHSSSSNESDDSTRRRHKHSRRSRSSHKEKRRKRDRRR